MSLIGDNKLVKSISDFVQRIFLVEKMINPIGIALMLFASIFIALISSKVGFFLSAILMSLIIAVAVGLFIFMKPKAGYIIAFILPFIGFTIQRRFNVDIKLGTLIQILIFASLFFILAQKLSKKDFSFSFIKNRITYFLLVFMLYNFIQGLNPNMHNMEGWYLIVRGNLSVFATYFVVLYLFQEKKFINQFLNVWITLAFIAALYACYQEWFGLAKFEIKWVQAEQLRFNRIFVKGVYRKFSLLSDPAAFGIFMAASSLIAIPLTLKKTTWIKKAFYLTAAMFMLVASGYSGTRTSFAMIPAGLSIFGLMTITNKRTLYLTAIGIASIAFILFGPIYGNPTVHRIRTIVNTDDASLNVRDVNRAGIQQYIYDHPIGGGVKTTGTAGLNFNPNHPLAGFPPDSGYLQLALEIGYIGLFLFMMLLFVALASGIRNYYQNDNEDEKTILLSFVSFTFAICIALYAQTITGQVPMSLVFYPVLGLMGCMNSSFKRY